MLHCLFLLMVCIPAAGFLFLPLCDELRNNVLLGDDSDVWTWLRAVCFDEEVREMEDREDAVVGNSGVRLSGGQAARLAMARMLAMESR